MASGVRVEKCYSNRLPSVPELWTTEKSKLREEKMDFVWSGIEVNDVCHFQGA